jgi:hypothetical protein
MVASLPANSSGSPLNESFESRWKESLSTLASVTLSEARRLCAARVDRPPRCRPTPVANLSGVHIG